MWLVLIRLVLPPGCDPENIAALEDARKYKVSRDKFGSSMLLTNLLRAQNDA